MTAILRSGRLSKWFLLVFLFMAKHVESFCWPCVFLLLKRSFEFNGTFIDWKLFIVIGLNKNLESANRR